MSVQRAEVHWARYLDGNRRVVLEADHARIVAEATAEARAAERRHWEARFRNAEQAHAAALAEAVRESAAHHYRMGKARGADLALNHDGGDEVMSDIPAPKMSANDAIGDILRFNIDSGAVAPRTLTADDPEPAVGSVVLGRYEISGQRVMDDDEETTIWRFSDGGWCYEWVTVQRMYGPVTLIHDGGAA